MEALITRADPDGVLEGQLGPHQAVSLEDAIEIFTVNGAWAMAQEDRVGSLEVGKRADLVVLDRNLLEVSPGDIGSTQVDLTILDGEVVFDRATPPRQP